LTFGTLNIDNYEGVLLLMRKKCD